MRIIAGAFKGRRLATPDWPGLRPTSDRLRETLFNILQHEVAGATVLDGYAGTGAIGLEAMSRGARHVTFIDQDRRAIALIETNVARCGGDAAARVLQGRLPNLLQHFDSNVRFDLIVLDPPYDFDARAIGGILSAAGAHLDARGRLVVERARRDRTPTVGGLTSSRRVTAGDSALEFYARAPS